MSTTPFEYYGNREAETDLAEAKSFLTELYKAGLDYHPDDQAEDCISGRVDHLTLNRIQSMMDAAWNAFTEADEDIHGFCIELDPEQVRNMIANRREDLAAIMTDATGRDLSADENREAGELTRDIERMEKLLECDSAIEKAMAIYPEIDPTDSQLAHADQLASRFLSMPAPQRITITQDDNEGCVISHTYHGISSTRAILLFVANELAESFEDHTLGKWVDFLTELAARVPFGGAASVTDPSIQGTVTISRA